MVNEASRRYVVFAISMLTKRVLMTGSSMLRHLFRLCIAACALTAAAAWADPPGRVGRTTYVEGEVSFYNDPDDGWQKAAINYPVTSENSFWIDGRGRAEVRIGPSAIRLGDNSIFDFVKLQDDVMLGFLQRGSVNVRIRQLGSYDPIDAIQIETNEGRFTLEGNGRYRVDAPADGESRISVFSGRARFESANRGEVRLTVDAGKQLTVRFNNVSNGGPDFRYDNVGESVLDRWAQDRDQQWDLAHTRYNSEHIRDTLISPYMTGYEELDASGDWIDDNEYGRLWTPRVVVSGWAPYRYGRWSYVRPWGWTWIDDAPWGFAPFHYGRWVQVRSRWCWWPGPYVGRPVYAPALVAWIGGGSSLTISSGPAIGWFPLAPREYYVPRYTTNIHYLRRINSVGNNVIAINPPSRYRNQVPGATVVGNNVFSSGRPIGPHLTHLPPGVVAGRSPLPSVDLPRPDRRPDSRAPDRQHGRYDGRPGTTPPQSPPQSPQPRFPGNPPSSGHSPVPPVLPPAAHPQTPKFRSGEPSVSGPLPIQQATPDVVPGGGQAGGYPSVAPATSPPVAQPRQRPQPHQSQPYPATAPGVPTPVESAPVMPDREVRPSQRSTGPRNRSQPEAPLPQASMPPVVVPQQAPVQAAPQIAPRPARQQSVAPPVVSPQPQAAPKVAPNEPKATPTPAHAPKPNPEAQEESRNDGRDKGRPR